MDDPIHFLVRKYGWCGVLLEPDPQLFERLKENYSGVDGPILVNAALSPINGKTTFYRIRMDEKMPNWCALLGSFRREVILSNKNDVPEIETHIVEDRIESISFHSLVARYKPPRIDLIVIDTEGYDLEILRQLDLIRFRPDLIVYEHKHLNERERTIAADLLIAKDIAFNLPRGRILSRCDGAEASPLYPCHRAKVYADVLLSHLIDMPPRSWSHGLYGSDAPPIRAPTRGRVPVTAMSQGALAACALASGLAGRDRRATHGLRSP